MGSRPVYKADREVIEECRTRGYEISARQLERWRSLLPDRVVEYEEGLRGSRSVNPPGYVDQVIAIAEALKSGLPMREVPLALFLREFPVELGVLRSAYLDILGRVRRVFDTFNAGTRPDATDSADQLDAVAAHMAARARRSGTGRRWEARARQAIRQRQIQAESARTLLSGVLSAALIGPFAGSQATSEGIAEVLEVFGLNDGQDPQQVASTLAAMNLDAITRVVQTATMDQWTAARTDLNEMRRYVELREQVEVHTMPAELRLAGLNDFSSHDVISQAAQIPGLLIIATDEWRESLPSQLAPLEALNSFLSVIPDEYHGPVLQNQLSEETLKELRPQAQAWAKQHPREAGLLNMSTDGET